MTELRSVAIAYTALTDSELTLLLGNVTTVHDNILIESCGTLTEIELAELTTVGGGIEVFTLAGCGSSSSAVTAIRMPKLVSVGAELVMQDMDQLVELSVDELTTVGAQLHFRHIKLLQRLSFPSPVLRAPTANNSTQKSLQKVTWKQAPKKYRI